MNTSRKYFKLPLMLIVSLFIAACGTDDSSDDMGISGEYTGQYREIDCDNNFDITVENTIATLNEQNETMISVSLGGVATVRDIALTATMRTDTSYTVTPFMSDGENLIGNVFLVGSNLRILLGPDDCTNFLGDNIATIRYEGDK